MVGLPILEHPDPPTTRDHISFSSLRLYAQCPLRYFFRYVANLPEPTVSSSLVIGSGFHAGVEAHYQALLEGRPALNLDELLDVFWDAWNERGEGIRFGKGEDLTSVGRLAERLFTAFLGSEIARPNGIILGVEEPLRANLISGLPDVLARIDLLVDAGDVLVLSDFKTSRGTWDADDVEQAADQLLLYSALIEPIADGRPVRLEFIVATKTKVPSLTRFPVTVDLGRVDRTLRVMERIWKSISAGHFFPSPSPMQCPSCPYREPCRSWPG